MGKGKKGYKSAWEAKIEWVDENTYLNLSPSDLKKLLRFRQLHSYLNKLDKSVKEGKKKLEKLRIGIEDREAKIKKYQKEGKGIYQFLERLKSKFEVTVYYSESERLKKTKEFSKIEATGVKGYKECIIRYKTKNSSVLKSIYLGPNRKVWIRELKEVLPNWYETIGFNLEKESGADIKKVKSEISKLFKPAIEKLLKKNYQKMIDGKYSLTKSQLFKSVKF